MRGEFLQTQAADQIDDLALPFTPAPRPRAQAGHRARTDKADLRGGDFPQIQTTNLEPITIMFARQRLALRFGYWGKNPVVQTGVPGF